MKRKIGFVCLFLLALAFAIVAAKLVADMAAEMILYNQPAVTEFPAETTTAATVETEGVETLPLPTQLAETAPAETEMPIVYDFTPEEEQLLLKLAMAERGNAYCTECMALVMRTVLNRVEGPKFSSTIRGVIYAKDQFTPVSDGSIDAVTPDDRCREALEMVRRGWDESQGALYYEWCEGASWHSKNLNLLFQHCDTRFYN